MVESYLTRLRWLLIFSRCLPKFLSSSLSMRRIWLNWSKKIWKRHLCKINSKAGKTLLRWLVSLFTYDTTFEKKVKLSGFLTGNDWHFVDTGFIAGKSRQKRANNTQLPRQFLRSYRKTQAYLSQPDFGKHVLFAKIWNWSNSLATGEHWKNLS